MSANKGLLGAVKAVETLMELSSVFVMKDTKCMTMTQNFVLVRQ